MRKARVFMHKTEAGILEELTPNHYVFTYLEGYAGPAVSLTMPVEGKRFEYFEFPPFFEGLLPEGMQLEALLRKFKLDKKDYFGQLMQVGGDVVGAASIKEYK